MDRKAFDFSTAPPEVYTLYAEACASARTKGATEAESAEAGNRALRLTGWFLTDVGWEKIGPDVSGKINLRQLEPQPDGNFLVRDVDTFLPNAAKYDPNIPGQNIFTAERIRRMIKNTNATINEGGQKPAIVKIHPSQEQKMVGVSIPAFGETFNWRESPKGDGWARCDILVPDSIAKDWKQRHYTGLSAGTAGDANSTNERFGHVALLGGDIQGLSGLPATEVFWSEGTVCFAADAAAFDTKGSTMPMDTIKKACYAAASHCYAAMAAAFASFEAGEQGAEEKMKQAKAKMEEDKAKFGADWPDNGLKTDAAPPGTEIAPPQTANASLPAGQNAKMWEQVDAVDGRTKGGDRYKGMKNKWGFGKEDYAANPGTANASGEPTSADAPATPMLTDDKEQPGEFPEGSKFSAQFAAMQNELKTDQQKLADTTAALNIVLGERIKSQVDAQFSAVAAEGHTFDAKAAMQLVEKSNYDKGTIDGVLAMIRTTPKRAATPADVGHFFAASPATNFSAGDTGAAPNPARIAEIINRNGIVPINMQSADALAKIGAAAAKLKI